MKIGLFCGTFNPIHIGHLLIAECARDQFSLSKIIFVTSPSPPHRQGEELLEARARHQMVEAAISGNQHFETSTIELDRPGPSYTIDTIEHFQRHETGSELHLIVGGDNIGELKTWHRSDDLLRSCHLLVAPRLMARTISPLAVDGSAIVTECHLIEFDQLAGALVSVIDFPGMAVSGTQIRRRLGGGLSVLYMVPPAVNKILVDNRYYQSGKKKVEK